MHEGDEWCLPSEKKYTGPALQKDVEQWQTRCGQCLIGNRSECESLPLGVIATSYS